MKPAVNGIKTFFFVADEGVKLTKQFVPSSLLALTTIIRPGACTIKLYETVKYESVTTAKKSVIKKDS